MSQKLSLFLDIVMEYMLLDNVPTEPDVKLEIQHTSLTLLHTMFLDLILQLLTSIDQSIKHNNKEKLESPWILIGQNHILTQLKMSKLLKDD